jgi:tripartite-type tricarboxylate transporter receptor subunit TctC
VAPAKTPDAIASQLNVDIVRILQTQEMKARLADLDAERVLQAGRVPRVRQA